MVSVALLICNRVSSQAQNEAQTYLAGKVKLNGFDTNILRSGSHDCRFRAVQQGGRGGRFEGFGEVEE
jgi:hypothetical protein